MHMDSGVMKCFGGNLRSLSVFSSSHYYHCHHHRSSPYRHHHHHNHHHCYFYTSKLFSMKSLFTKITSAVSTKHCKLHININVQTVCEVNNSLIMSCVYYAACHMVWSGLDDTIKYAKGGRNIKNVCVNGNSNTNVAVEMIMVRLNVHGVHHLFKP